MGIDLLKIESRPIKGRPWEYHFYLICRPQIQDEKVIEALAELGERASEVRVLGCYRRGAGLKAGDLPRQANHAGRPLIAILEGLPAGLRVDTRGHRSGIGPPPMGLWTRRADED